MDTAVPVPPERLPDHYRDVVSMQSERMLAWRKAARRARWGEGSLLALCLMLGAALIWYPRVRVIPAFIYLDNYGMQSTATAISDLPPDTRVAGIEQTLWTYVRECEHYTPSEADYSYQVCSALSGDMARQRFQAFANPKLNKEAPAIKVGARGFIRVYRRKGAWISHDPDFGVGVYQIGFCRVVSVEGQGTLAQPMVATLRYELISRVPLWERVTFNAFGVAVTEYNSEPDGQVRPVVAVPLSTDNPCG